VAPFIANGVELRVASAFLRADVPWAKPPSSAAGTRVGLDAAAVDGEPRGIFGSRKGTEDAFPDTAGLRYLNERR
jgi:hypothetical protein